MCVCMHLYMYVGTLIVATIYLQLIQNRYMFRSFTVLQCSHQHCVYSSCYLHVHGWITMIHNVTRLRRLALECSWHVIKRQRIRFRISFYT
jgi:hypothetical protein